MLFIRNQEDSVGEKDNFSGKKGSTKIQSKDEKPKKNSTVDLELPEEELNKVAGGSAGAAGTWSCRGG
jgi:hypothetical protein